MKFPTSSAGGLFIGRFNSLLGVEDSGENVLPVFVCESVFTDCVGGRPSIGTSSVVHLVGGFSTFLMFPTSWEGRYGRLIDEYFSAGFDPPTSNYIRFLIIGTEPETAGNPDEPTYSANHVGKTNVDNFACGPETWILSG